MKYYRGILILMLILVSIFLCAINVSAQEKPNLVIINSNEWIDVYTGMNYANLNNIQSKFLVTDNHIFQMMPTLSKEAKIMVIESQMSPQIVGLSGTLRDNGFDVVDEFISEDTDSTNIEFGERTGTKNFIVIDDSYGYNAVSVGPYATLTNSFILFADENNIADVIDFLDRNGVDKLILYGTVDRFVRTELQKYDPDVIDFENRFDNNLEIAKRFQEQKPAKQVLFTNGEFLEDQLVSGGNGREPIIFVGKDKVPPQVVEYVKNSNIEIGVLIGNDLTYTAKILKDQADISVFIKFGKGTAGTEYKEVEALDRFVLPSYDLMLAIDSVIYNTATKQLEVVYRNEKELTTYFKSTITILVNDEKKRTVGDPETVLIGELDTMGIGYDLDLTEELRNPDTNIVAEIILPFGESPKSMDKGIEATFPVETTTIEDRCDVKTMKLVYNKKTQRFVMTIDNVAATSCYVDPRITDLTINDKKKTISYEGNVLVGSQQSKELTIKQRMDEVDIADNPQIKIKTLYGERQDLLLKVDEAMFDLIVVSGGMGTGMLIGIGAVVAVVIIILLVLLLRKKQSVAKPVVKQKKSKTRVSKRKKK
jgi:hypothetical protein